MKAISVDHQDQDPQKPVLRLVEVPSLNAPLGPHEAKIALRATAVNRADLLQARGLYPPPPGASPILGLEGAGVIVGLGEALLKEHSWQLGDEVMALLPGGGYAEEVIVDAGSLLKKPTDWSFSEAAAFCETFLTVFLNIFILGALKPREKVLIHGGGSGIGTAAINLLKASQLAEQIIVTAGSDQKCQKCLELGADVALNYQQEDFKQALLARYPAGVDIILDCVGGPYLARNLQCLKLDGRLVIIGLMGGAKSEINLATLVSKRLAVIGSSLRSRTPSQKAQLIQDFTARFNYATLRPSVDRVLPLSAAETAHQLMYASTHFGKIVLKIREDVAD